MTRSGRRISGKRSDLGPGILPGSFYERIYQRHSGLAVGESLVPLHIPYLRTIGCRFSWREYRTSGRKHLESSSSQVRQVRSGWGIFGKRLHQPQEQALREYQEILGDPGRSEEIQRDPRRDSSKPLSGWGEALDAANFLAFKQTLAHNNEKKLSSPFCALCAKRGYTAQKQVRAHYERDDRSLRPAS